MAGRKRKPFREIDRGLPSAGVELVDRRQVLRRQPLDVLAGCGERSQTAHYEDGRYRGKPDTPSYQAAPFNGDAQKYNAAMRERAQYQNEYNRIK